MPQTGFPDLFVWDPGPCCPPTGSVLVIPLLEVVGLSHLQSWQPHTSLPSPPGTPALKFGRRLSLQVSWWPPHNIHGTIEHQYLNIWATTQTGRGAWKSKVWLNNDLFAYPPSGEASCCIEQLLRSSCMGVFNFVRQFSVEGVANLNKFRKSNRSIFLMSQPFSKETHQSIHLNWKLKK